MVNLRVVRISAAFMKMKVPSLWSSEVPQVELANKAQPQAPGGLKRLKRCYKFFYPILGSGIASNQVIVESVQVLFPPPPFTCHEASRQCDKPAV